MLEALFNFIISAFMWLIGVVGSIVIYPLQLLIVSIFPTLGNFVSVCLDFFTDYFFPIVSFIKEWILIMTGIPRELYLIFVGIIIARWTIAPAVRSIRFIINMWKVWKGSV